MKVKPLLFVAGGVGAVAAGAAVVVKRRAGGQGAEAEPRYAPPAEGLAQTPTEPGGPPSAETVVRESPPVASEPGDQLNVAEHDAPGDAVMADTSSDDPLVRQQERAAASDAAALGGNVDEMAAGEAGFAGDPTMRPVVEGGGDENEETFEAREEIDRGDRKTEP